MGSEVTVYTRTTCAPCKALKMFLQHKGILYKEMNVDEHPEYEAEIQKLSGFMMVPTAIIRRGDEQSVISGYNPARLVSALA